LIVLAGLAACSPKVAPSAGSPSELGSSFNVLVAGDSVVFELHITNATTRPIALEFATSQRYDVEIWSNGSRVWRWSDGKSFAQVLGEEAMAPGETRRYTAAWHPSGPGAWEARGRVTSTNYPVGLRTEFRFGT
jgi:hypothetical protein